MTLLGLSLSRRGLDLCVICMIDTTAMPTPPAVVMDSATSPIVPGLFPGFEAVVRPVT